MEVSSSESPSWLNAQFFSELLSEREEEPVVVESMSLLPANNKGENYSSIMLRANLQIRKSDHTELPRSYIVKLDPVGMTQDMMNKFNVFPKEIEVYESLLPYFERLLCEVAPEGQPVNFGPKCVKTNCGTQGPGNMLIMEDLCARGFRTVNRLQGLDLEHAELALKVLARFHAASAVYYQEVDKTVSGHFQYGLYAEHMKPILYDMYGKNIEMMREVSSGWNCRVPMHRFLDNYKEKMLDRVFQLISKYQEEGRFVVLCHGDFWCNNVMFRYDEEDVPEQCLLLDFQLANFNSPAFDLNYFIFTSIRKDLKLSHIDHFIHVYHKELVLNLEKLKYIGEIPTLFALHREFQDIGAFALNSTYGTLCAVLAPPGMDSDMNSLLGDDEKSRQFRRHLFSNPLYVEALEELIPYFERKGIF